VFVAPPDAPVEPSPGAPPYFLAWWLTGGDGRDILIGQIGRDVFNGGAGDDALIARDGTAELVICGEGVDVAFVDPEDQLRGCEIVLSRLLPTPARLAGRLDALATAGRLSPAGATAAARALLPSRRGSRLP
jgi:hypothetical protein